MQSVSRSDVEDFLFTEADLLDQLSLIEILDRNQPDEVYNLAAMSFVPTSWQQPVLTALVAHRRRRHAGLEINRGDRRTRPRISDLTIGDKNCDRFVGRRN